MSSSASPVPSPTLPSPSSSNAEHEFPGVGSFDLPSAATPCPAAVVVFCGFTIFNSASSPKSSRSLSCHLNASLASIFSLRGSSSHCRCSAAAQFLQHDPLASVLQLSLTAQPNLSVQHLFHPQRHWIKLIDSSLAATFLNETKHLLCSPLHRVRLTTHHPQWVKQQRGWTRERFRELEAVFFTIFVDNLPECMSKKELFYLFGWSSMINDIWMKGELLHLFAFIRYTTKSGALKAITKMNHMSLNGRRICVGEAKNRRDDRNHKIYESPRTVAKEDIEVVKGREIDLAADLVRLEYGWSFLQLSIDSTELVTMNREGDEEQEGITMLQYEILNEWNFEKKNKSDRGESSSSEGTVTQSYERKECDENKLIILDEIGVETDGAMELSGSLEINEFVSSSGVRSVEIMNVGSHDKQLDSQRKDEDAKMPEMASKSVRRERQSTPTMEIGPSVSDDEEDFMSGLKELNEIRDLKRREAKRKEKTRKSRPKKVKI
ncbi:hypothetical protein PIB30_015578 [Stylosanthes scabra]|uniref:RRM domain-containing protein n=1 Tax=Stylosanthes scabra TaxID=79078 RepID=A0ABU6Q737_9FABA|nr:hypothetical protein [Stylosanthes scabra]